ncbi:Alpha-(1,3)-fucosyltransferase C [Halotydeus destructor]|nr:Alpha-(1,3)-fucosyltransferase C [Halotydeus destructor]
MNSLQKAYLCFFLFFGLLALVFYIYLYILSETVSSTVLIDSNRKLSYSSYFRTSGESRNITILLWTPFFGVKDYVKPIADYGCDYSNCQFTFDRNQLNRSDAIIFHVRDTDLNDLPQYRDAHQRWALLHHEAPPHTPRATLHGLNGLINWTITYRLDSDIVLTPKLIKKSNPLPDASASDQAQKKSRMIAWFVSNCNTPSHREDFVTELRKTIPVDIYGDCGPFQCQPKMSTDCYDKIANQYRFYLSFENSLCKDYLTEKFLHVTQFNIIPIVFGGANYSKMAAPRSYIDALSFKSPKQLGKHLIRLAKNADEYNEYFNWKRKFTYKADPYPCQLCRKLNDVNEPTKFWNNLVPWWFDEGKCRQWSVNGLQDASSSL